MNKSGFVLIFLGCLFLANNLGWLSWGWVRDWWPLFLIGLGLWTLIDQKPTKESTRRDERS